MQASTGSRSTAIADRALGIVGGAMVLAALGLLLFGGGARDTTAPGPPAISLVEPAPGAVVEGPLPVSFRVPGRFQAGPMGWQSGEYHLHVVVDGTEFMPAAADIMPIGGDSYRWTLRGLSPGPRTIRLFWSGADHQALRQGASEPVTVEVRGHRAH